MFEYGLRLKPRAVLQQPANHFPDPGERIRSRAPTLRRLQLAPQPANTTGSSNCRQSLMAQSAFRKRKKPLSTICDQRATWVDGGGANLLGKGWSVYLGGGFGRATLDIVRALNEADAAWLPAAASAPPSDSRWSAALDLLKQRGSDPQWKGMNNGSTESENRRFAATHRPSDVAALVSIGLGRLAAAGRFGKDPSRN
jgi:hypothetical protein